MDDKIIISIIGAFALFVTNVCTAFIISKQIRKREEKKYNSDLKIKIAEYAAEHPEKLLQIEKN